VQSLQSWRLPGGMSSQTWKVEAMGLAMRIAVGAMLSTALTGCRTIRKGPTQSVTFVSSPPGARVTIDAGGNHDHNPGSGRSEAGS